MSGRAGQEKGKRGEREMIDLLQPIVNEVYDTCGLKPPTLQRNTVQADEGGYDIIGLRWLALEVKRQELLKVPQWWEQATRQAGADKVPVLAFKTNGNPWRYMTWGTIGTGGNARTVPVLVRGPDFRDWFRARLVQEIERDLRLGVI